MGLGSDSAPGGFPDFPSADAPPRDGYRQRSRLPVDASEQRLEALVRRCGRRAWTVAWSLLRDGHEAHDAVQQALLVAARKVEKVPTDDPWPWFGVVVAHEARNLRRKRRPTPTGSLLEDDAVIRPRDEPDASRQATRRDEQRRLQAALDQLPREERDAVSLVHLAGMSHAAAAEALGVPRQTLTSRVARGMATLEHDLARPRTSVAGALAVLPIVAPPGGFETAFATWTQTALTSLAGGSAATTTALGGLTLMSSKTWLALTLTAAVGMGFLGGHVATTNFLDGGPGASKADVALAPQGADARSPGPSSDSPVADPTLGASDESLRAMVRRLQDERDEQARRLEAQGARLAELEKRVGEEVEQGPTFTFGEFGALAAVREADWSEMAASSNVVGDSVRSILEHKEAGEPIPKEIYLALQENVERMRKYEYRTIGKMPTAAKHNGEITHPITMANLFAALLQDAGHPLSDEQVTAIAKLGTAFDREFAAQRERHRADTPRVARILEEYRLKGRFAHDLAAVLSAEQRAVVYDESTRGIAGLDLHDPTLMILHTSPVLVGATIDEIATKLRGLLAKKLDLGEEGAARLDAPLESWKQDVRGLLEPVPSTRLKHYSYAQGETAGAATVRLVQRLLGELELGAEIRKALLDDFAIYVPRVVAKPS